MVISWLEMGSFLVLSFTYPAIVICAQLLLHTNFFSARIKNN